jgi:polysaccharide chain length determinant protein (PEP-CTERM system associated)
MELEEENTGGKSVSDYLQIIKRRNSIIIIPILILWLISLIGALILPPLYRSEATILIEQQSIPLDMVRTTVVSYVDQRIMQIGKKLMTVHNLNKIIDKFDLYPQQRNKASLADLAYQFRESITLDIINQDVIARGRKSKATLSFKLAFEHKDPMIAQKVTSELTTLFLNENIKSRTKKAKETADFLEDEAKKYGRQIQKSEREISQYKEKNSRSLPELLPVNLGIMSRIETNLLQLELEEKMLSEKEITLQGQLLLINPLILTEIELIEKKKEKKKKNKKVLPQLKAQYSMLLTRYSEIHPDVKAFKKRIDNFVEEVEEEEEEEAAVIKPPTPSIKNPAYLQLESALKFNSINIKNIKKNKDILRHKLLNAEKNIANTAKVENGYQDLKRGLENYKVKYQELKSKALEAKLSQTLEEELKAEKFSLLEPPIVPEKPEKPKRRVILLGGLGASLAFGLILGVLVEIIDGSLRGARSLAKITHHDPLVVIPYIKNKADRRKNRQKGATLIIIIMIFLFLYGATIGIHLFYKKLYFFPEEILFLLKK